MFMLRFLTFFLLKTDVDCVDRRAPGTRSTLQQILTIDAYSITDEFNRS